MAIPKSPKSGCAETPSEPSMPLSCQSTSSSNCTWPTTRWIAIVPYSGCGVSRMASRPPSCHPTWRPKCPDHSASADRPANWWLTKRKSPATFGRKKHSRVASTFVSWLQMRLSARPVLRSWFSSCWRSYWRWASPFYWLCTFADVDGNGGMIARTYSNVLDRSRLEKLSLSIAHRTSNGSFRHGWRANWTSSITTNNSMTFGMTIGDILKSHRCIHRTSSTSDTRISWAIIILITY